MKSLSLITLILIIGPSGLCQSKHDYVWMLGDEVDSTYNYYGVSKFDFSNESLNITKQNEGLNMYVSNASICDSNGNLLFYSNGCKIKNFLNEVIENGEGLNPGGAYITGNCPDGGNSISKGVIILPLSNNSDKYLLVHQPAKIGVSPPFSYFIDKLYYTVVDMNANNGHGKVLEKNITILSDTIYSDLHAVRHVNGNDWWVIISRQHSNDFYKILFDANGEFDVETQKIGPNNDPWSNGGGQAVFSPDGTKYARYDKVNQVSLFDFDRSIGELSNYQQLNADTFQLFGGLSFSPNSQYLYVSTLNHLYQYDLLASDIQASRIEIAEWDGFYDEISGLPVNMFLMQLGPDCKLYMVGLQGTRYMHVINRPDEPGLACDFQQHGIQLPTFNTASIPNFPNYRLGTGQPVCDSNIVYVSSRYVPPPLEEVRVYPNPATSEVTVSLPSGTGPGSFTLYDATGQQLRSWALSAGQQEARFGLEGLPQGMYFWQAERKGKALGSGKLIIQK